MIGGLPPICFYSYAAPRHTDKQILLLLRQQDFTFLLVAAIESAKIDRFHY